MHVPSLEDMRKRIADIDRRLLEDLALRFRWVCLLQEVKRRHGLSAVDLAQEARVLSAARRAAVDLGLSDQLAEHVLDCVIQEGKAALGLPTSRARPPSSSRDRRGRPRPAVPTRGARARGSRERPKTVHP
jgi:chorismate mutase